MLEHCHDVYHDVVEPEDGEVGSHHEWSNVDTAQVAYKVLHRVCVGAGDADRRCPLVVGLVDVLVQATMMQQPGKGQGRGGEGKGGEGKGRRGEGEGKGKRRGGEGRTSVSIRSGMTGEYHPGVVSRPSLEQNVSDLVRDTTYCVQRVLSAAGRV